MKLNLAKFKETLPYASELFGVYQPLIGWRSKTTQNRLESGKGVLGTSFSSKAIGRITAEIPSITELPTKEFSFDGPLKVPLLTETVQISVSSEIYCVSSLLIAGRLDLDEVNPNTKWKHVETDKLDLLLNESGDSLKRIVPLLMNFQAVNEDKKIVSYIENFLKQEMGGSISSGLPIAGIIKKMMEIEAKVLSYLNWLYREGKWVLLETLFSKEKKSPLKDILAFADPIENFGENDLTAVLSPIGIVNVSRQYFFEFDTFLGPPVGHIWIAPGGTVELTESSSRRTQTDRYYESSVDSTFKSEDSTMVHDEISSAVKEENKSNTKFGFDTSVKYTIQGTLEAGGSAKLDMEQARTNSRESTNKQMREQSQKLSSEIRKTFKSSFRVTTDVLDSTSKRYVIQNTTSKLVNYELRRKMRQIGIQVQEISMQLCWQTYVDKPGNQLGLGTLLHIAPSPDFAGLQPPEAPVQLPQKQAEAIIQFPYENISGGDDMGALYRYGDDGDGRSGVRIGYHNDRIVYRRKYKIDPPAPGYEMDTFIGWQAQHSGVLSADVVKLSADGSFEVILKEVNFEDQPAVNIKVTTTWKPAANVVAKIQAEYEEKVKDFTAEKANLAHDAFLKTAKERVKLASGIKERPFEDLREEERIMVYRNLIGKLMQVGEKNHEHITSELIRSIFDTEKMLYFVAPEWWQPRYAQKGQTLGSNNDPQTPIENAHLTGWGGLNDAARNNYYITEESEPAKMGSSLGWVMQLDGDMQRNMFLNSPWVKAIIPIRPGKELAALNWLMQAHVEGADGLEAAYVERPEKLAEIRKRLTEIGVPVGAEISLRDALHFLADQIQQLYKKANTVSPNPEDPTKSSLPTETVFEHGYYPLKGSFKVNQDPLRVFAEWVEVLPTDQVVALPYTAEDHL